MIIVYRFCIKAQKWRLDNRKLAKVFPGNGGGWVGLSRCR